MTHLSDKATDQEVQNAVIIHGADELPAWQYHGTQMFLAEDRIDYLRRHL